MAVLISRQIALVIAVVGFTLAAGFLHHLWNWKACGKGSTAACTELMSSVFETDTDLAVDYNNRGLGYKAEKNYHQAIADLTSALHLRPRYPVALSNRAAVYYEINDFEDALKDLDAALIILPSYALAFNNRAELEIKTGKYDAAMADYSSAISSVSVDENDAKAKFYCNRALLSVRLGNIIMAQSDIASANSISKDTQCFNLRAPTAP